MGGRGRSKRSVLVVGLVVLLGALGTGLATVALDVSARAWSDRAFDQKQDAVGKVVQSTLIQYSLALADLAAATGAQAELTAGSFAAITSTLNRIRIPGAIEVSYVVPGTTATTPGLQTQWRKRGSSSLHLQPAASDSGDHYFPVLGRALDGGTVELGGDLRQTPEVVEALRIARAEGGIATSRTYPTAGDSDRSFVLAAAVYATSPLSQAGQFRGWVAMAFHGHDFLGPAVGVIGGDQVDIELADISGAVPVTIASWQPAVRLDTDLAARTVAIAIPADRWQLTVRATVRLLPTAQAWLSRGAAAVGGLLTLLLAALTATIVTSRDRALRRVDHATAELRDDIERREAVEQQLRRREEELVGFAGVVAHDLRSPLANVLGYTELMATAPDDGMSEKQRGQLTRVRTSAARMRDLIDDLLAYATANNATLRSTEIDLDEMVENILAERLGGGGGDAPRIQRSALPTVLGDPGQVRQVLDNLIGNAIKYTPTGQAAEISISSSGTPSTCRIEVADRGIGIPDEQRAEVFNAFTRAEGSEKYPGTGLGLAIVQRIVERHGGTVGADANPGGGTLFWFTLPTPAPAPAPTASAPAPPAPVPAGPRG